MIEITRARPEDAAALTRIARAAKAHWGYPPAWIEHWHPALTLTPDYIAAHPTFIAVRDNHILGFHALQFRTTTDVILDHLWVLPATMRTGIGRTLFEHAEQLARQSGATRLEIVGDPHAEGFYLRMGATLYGHQPAPVDGQPRFLPLLEKSLR